MLPTFPTYPPPLPPPSHRLHFSKTHLRNWKAHKFKIFNGFGAAFAHIYARCRAGLRFQQTAFFNLWCFVLKCWSLEISRNFSSALPILSLFEVISLDVFANKLIHTAAVQWKFAEDFVYKSSNFTFFITSALFVHLHWEIKPFRGFLSSCQILWISLNSNS